MSNIRKMISISIAGAVIACSAPASAQFGGFGGMGMGGFPGMGMGGFGGMGMGGMGMGMGGMGMGGMGMAGMAISALAAAAQQNQYNRGYGYRRTRYRAYQQPQYYYQQDQYDQGYAYPQTQYSATSQKPPRSRKGHGCYQQEWDATEGYVNVAAPCR